MNQLEIRIIGKQGAGKSLMAQQLASYLSAQHGFKVVLKDEMNGCVILPEVDAALPEAFNANITITTEISA